MTERLGGACCDSKGNKFDLFYPTNLGGNGFKHPILTWGNGTKAHPGQYDYFLKHLASWGFVIVATEDENTGVGQTIVDATKYMIGENSNPSSIFFHKLDVKEIGTLGHSQGAVGAINAMIESGGSIKTVIAIELPRQFFCSSKANCTDTKNLTAGSIFFIDGSKDGISPPTQYSWESGEQSIQAYYDATPSRIAKVKGTLIGPDHLDAHRPAGLRHRPGSNAGAIHVQKRCLRVPWISDRMDDGPASGRHLRSGGLHKGQRRNIL